MVFVKITLLMVALWWWPIIIHNLFRKTCTTKEILIPAIATAILAYI